MTLFLKSTTLAFALLFGASAALAQAPSAPIGRRHLYSETADPRADIAAAITQARREHKHILLDFGGDWCGDCQVLDIYFHQPQNQALLNKSFIVVHIFTDEDFTKNLEIGKKYGVLINKGVPALAVLDDQGKLLVAQRPGEFSSMRYMDASAVTTFLNRWKT